jgi:hypothetical protein
MIYRGIVQDVADPEQRKRARVRVINVHRDDVPVNALPWAEWCMNAGKGFGDIPSLEVGDAVFVDFEDEGRRFPVIMGGWPSYQGGTNDMPNELLGDYAKNQQRWIRVDRSGNKITMSPLPDEAYIEIASGDSKITVRSLDGSFEVVTDARTTIRSPQVQVLGATEVSVETERLVAQVSDEATLQCSDTVNVQGAQTINIGTYQQPTTALPPPPKTTGTVNIDANQLVHARSLQAMEFIAGTTIGVDAQGDITVHSTSNITITGDAKVEVNSTGPVNVNAREVAVVTDTAKVTVNAQTDIELSAGGKVAVTAATDVNVTASGNNVNVNSAANVSVEAGGNASVTCAGNATVEASGLMRLTSASKVEITAPIVEIDADSLLSLNGGGTARLDGGVILIG